MASVTAYIITYYLPESYKFYCVGGIFFLLLAIDVGNTNITIGAYDGSELVFTARMTTDLGYTADQYAIGLNSLLRLNKTDPGSFDGSIISSVVPPITNPISRAVERLTGTRPLIVGPGIKTGLNILIDDPSQLGADIAVAAVAARALYHYPSVICDLGTASTIFVLDKKGNMIGGLIYPGVRTSLEALVQNTSLLQLISFDAPARVIGKNTVESMQSGVIYGGASLLDGMISRIEKELGESVTAIATGGLARGIIDHCEREFIYNENLILEGLKIVYDKNR